MHRYLTSRQEEAMDQLQQLLEGYIGQDIPVSANLLRDALNLPKECASTHEPEEARPTGLDEREWAFVQNLRKWVAEGRPTEPVPTYQGEPCLLTQEQRDDIINACNDTGGLDSNGFGGHELTDTERWPESQFGGDGPWNNHGGDDQDEQAPAATGD